MRPNVLLLSTLALSLLLSCRSTSTKTQAPPPRPTAPAWKEATAKALRRWQGLRFGMFIHWGPVSLKGTEIGWSRGGRIPKEVYDRLYLKFDPVKFDADAWAETARRAGMKYLVLVTKHHDGFCLWPTKYTDYNISHTPFKRDIVGELARACRRKGVLFCTYYSILDWHHPDYPTDSPAGRKKKPHPNMDRYFRFVEDQTRELIENYGPLGTMWFDGDWERPWTSDLGEKLYAFLKGLQPDLLVDNRLGKRKGKRVLGDFATPEQRIGSFDRVHPWETCMTICRQWAWKPQDKLKTLKECLSILVRTAGGDGNLLLNVGPMPDGRIEPRQVKRLEEIGDWMRKYGDCIYETRGGPYLPGTWGASTCKGDRIHLFLLEPPPKGILELPALPVKVLSARLLSGGKIRFRQEGGKLRLFLSPSDPVPPVLVVRLRVEGKAFGIPPLPARFPSGSLAFHRPSRASNVFRKRVKIYGPAKALDDDPETRWATDAGTKAAWLEVDLGSVKEIGKVRIDECVRYGRRVRKFQLEVRADEDGPWKVLFSAGRMGRNFLRTFPPVKARWIRLHVLQAANGPTIWEFQVFPPGR